MLHDEPLEESFRRALYDLVRAVEEERGAGAVEIVAKWTGVKASTIYAWMEGQNSPSRWQYVVRLSIRSTHEGFTEMGAFVTSPKTRLAWFGEVIVDGCLGNELRELIELGGQLSDAERAGNGEAVLTVAAHLDRLADKVRGEGQMMVGRKNEPVHANGQH